MTDPKQPLTTTPTRHVLCPPQESNVKEPAKEGKLSQQL